MTTARRSMGLGRIASPTITFARKFRFTLEGTGLPEYFVKKAYVDYFYKVLSFAYLDVHDGDESFSALKWARNLEDNHKDSILTLTTYDGCGATLYKVTFKDLRLIDHTSDFDYESSDPSAQNIAVKFATWDVEYFAIPEFNKLTDEELAKRDAEEGTQQAGRIQDAVKTYNNAYGDTKVHFLNSVLTIPGKVIDKLRGKT